MPKKQKKEISREPVVQSTKSAAVVAPARSFSLSEFRVQALILAVIGFLFYCNTFSNEQAFDDRMAIAENEYVQQGVSGIPAILTKDAYQSYLEQKKGSNQLAGGRYRPLSLITFAIEQQIMGPASEGENSNDKEARIGQEMHTRHVVNVLLYMLSVIVLLYFFRQVLFPGSPIIAFLAALIFTIHPIHTEVVANVKSRDEILSVLFISLTFIKAFRYRSSNKVSDLIQALLCFFLALLSKEYGITLLVLLPLSFYLFSTPSVGKSIKGTLPYLIPAALYLLLRFSSVTAAAQGAENNILNNPYLYATGAQKVASEIAVLLNYLKLLVFPYPLCADYSYNQIPYKSFADPVVWVSLAVYLALIVSMCVLFVRRHPLCFAIAVYLANLLPVSNLFFNIGAPMGDRLIYHSSIGFSITAACLLYKGFEQIRPQPVSRGALAAVMILLIILSGYETIARNRDWKNDGTLFLTDVKNAPNSVLVNNNAAAACMGLAKLSPGGPDRKEWFTKAITYYDKAIKLYPQDMLCYLNRGLCYFDEQEPDKALPDWDTVRKYAPAQPSLSRYLSVAGKYYVGRGIKFEQAGKHDSAIIAFNKGTEAAPEAGEAWYGLAAAHFGKGDYSDAKAAAAKAVQLSPANEAAHKLYDQLNAMTK